MTPRLQKLYELSLLDSEFINDAGRYEEDADWKEVAMSQEIGRYLLAMCYWGWLVAKGRAAEVKSKLPPKPLIN